MVMAVVSELGKVRPVCFARSMLLKAADSMDRGETTTAGCQLREAVSRYLFAMCEAHDCLPRKKEHRTPARMARAVYKAGALQGGGYQWLTEIIDAGNRCAHCRPVRVSLLRTCISLMHTVLDYSPEILSPERQGGAV